jgi:hypothetical protein
VNQPQPAASTLVGICGTFQQRGTLAVLKEVRVRDGGDARVPESKRNSACFISEAFRIDPHWEATINDPEYYTESWTVLMKIAWVDGSRSASTRPGKKTRSGEQGTEP